MKEFVRCQKALAMLMAVICCSKATSHLVGGHKDESLRLERTTDLMASSKDTPQWPTAMAIELPDTNANDLSQSPRSQAQATSGKRKILRRIPSIGQVSTAASEDNVKVNLLQRSFLVKTDSDHTRKLQRRARHPSYTDEQLKAVGITDEELARYARAREGVNAFNQAMTANREAKAAGQAPPYSEEDVEELRPGNAEYKQMNALIRALMSGDEARIKRARQSAEVEYDPRAYSDEELRLVFTDAEIKRYTELKRLANAWNRARSSAKEAGRVLKDEDLTPQERALRRGSSGYNAMNYKIQKALRETDHNANDGRGTRHFRDGELKEYLDLESLADFVKGRRLSTEYKSLMKQRRQAAETRSEPPDVSNAELRKLRSAIYLYRDILEVARQGRAAAERGEEGQTAPIEQASVEPDREQRLFTAEEEKRVKRVLELPEIEEYVEGRRAQRDLARAEASNEAARREGRKPFSSPRELQELQRKVERYQGLRKVVDGRHARLEQQPSRARQKGQKRGPAAESTDRLQFSSQHPSSLTDQMKAGLKQLVSHWQNVQPGPNGLSRPNGHMPNPQGSPASGNTFPGRSRVMRIPRRV